MEVRAGSVKHFEGKEGVWYQPEQNELWVITNKNFTMVRGHKGIETYWLYDVEAHRVKEKQIVITGDGHFEYIGAV